MQPKDIPGYEGVYRIYPTGDILNVRKNFFIKQGKCPQGYPTVKLYEGNRVWDTRRVHRLLAQAFIPNPAKKPYVNHKDGNKTNNALDNLEWCTPAENAQHAWANGLSTKPPKLDHAERKKALDMYLSGTSPQDLYKQFDCGRRLMEWLEETAQQQGLLDAFHVQRRKNKSAVCKNTGADLAKAVRCYTKEGVFIGEYPSQITAAKALGISQGNIANVIAGRAKSAGGYIWEPAYVQ